jgi:hypothetical protein
MGLGLGLGLGSDLDLRVWLLAGLVLHLVWRGVISRVLGKKSHSDEKIGQSMARVFADFPPA